MLNSNLCWICVERPATTGEHKFPHAYLKRIPDDWSSIDHGQWSRRKFHTQGPNSINLKNKVLCQLCNNQRTQLQDLALDSFLVQATTNQFEIWKTRRLDLAEYLTGHDVFDFYRGLLKLEFSRLYADGIDVVPEVSRFVNGGENWRSANDHVRIEFRVTDSAEALGLAYPFDSDAPYYEHPYFISHQINFGWLGIHFLYAPGDRPDVPWPPWELSATRLTSGELQSFIPRID